MAKQKTLPVLIKTVSGLIAYTRFTYITASLKIESLTQKLLFPIWFKYVILKITLPGRCLTDRNIKIAGISAVKSGDVNEGGLKNQYQYQGSMVFAAY